MPLRGWMWCQIVTRALFLFMRAGSWHKNNWKLTNEWVWARSWTCRTCLNSHSASDKYVGIIEETGIWNTDAFQYSINSTLSSGEFSKSSANKQKAVGTTDESAIEIQLWPLTASCREAVVYRWFNRTLCKRGAVSQGMFWFSLLPHYRHNVSPCFHIHHLSQPSLLNFELLLSQEHVNFT